MIESLRIEEIKIVEAAELEFGPGLNVLTGETGAGKSIILGALEMLAGARGSADIPRQGAEVGTVEAVFRTDGLPGFEEELVERGFREEGESEEHELVVHRTLNRSGRSRARVAGQLVPISTLTEVFAERIEISSQHSSQALLRPESHGRYLDASGDLLGLRGKVEAGIARLREIDGELASLRAEREDRERQRDFLAFQLEEIEAVAPNVEEWRELEGEHGRLAHAGQLREDGAAVVHALEGDSSGSEGAIDRIATALRLAEGLERLDPRLAALTERLRAADLELRDITRDFERHTDGVETDPGRLAQVEERVAQIEKLRRKYGQSIEDILAFRDQTAEQLAGIEGASDRETGLEEERKKVEARVTKDAKKLSKGRAKAARTLAEDVGRSLDALDMQGAHFEVDLSPAPTPQDLPCGSAGFESPEFKFSANKKEVPAPLQKVASGGELSRVFLAIKNALRREGRGMVLVFDEVDAGIGGRAAGRVGQALAELAAHHQVLCITHLPQIAAFADVHFRVEKSEKAGRIQAHVERLGDQDRVEEIARMAGGEEVTASTRRHARELLKRKPLS